MRLHGHLPRPLGHLPRGFLRGRDHEHLGAGQEPGHRDRNVAGPGGEVGEQEVQLAPVHVAEELLDGFVQHRPPPDDRLLLGDEEAHRDDPDPVRLQRKDHVVEADGPARHAHHAGHGESPHVDVDDPDPMSLSRQRGRQVHCDGRLAHAALARSHRDHGGVSIGEERPLLDGSGPAAQLRHQVLALILVHLAEDDLDALARIQDGPHRSPDIGVDAVLQRAAGDREQHVHADDPVVDLDALEHPNVLDGLADLGVEDLSKGLSNLFLGGHG